MKKTKKIVKVVVGLAVLAAAGVAVKKNCKKAVPVVPEAVQVETEVKK